MGPVGGPSTPQIEMPQYPGLYGTSTTFQYCSTGSKTFTTQENLNFNTTAYVRITSRGDPAGKWMIGNVTSYSGTSLVVNVTRGAGSQAAASDWDIGLNTAPSQYWFSTIGQPSSSLGADGDWAADTDGTIWNKVSGIWQAVFNAVTE
jgi:hypothetical protein